MRPRPQGCRSRARAASGGSTIWDDYHRGQNRKAGGYGPYSAVCVAEAKEAETILYATQLAQKTNPQFGILTDKTNRPMTPWYVAGAAAIYSGETATYFPPAEAQGGWPSLVTANETASAGRRHACANWPASIWFG